MRDVIRGMHTNTSGAVGLKQLTGLARCLAAFSGFHENLFALPNSPEIREPAQRFKNFIKLYKYIY